MKAATAFLGLSRDADHEIMKQAVKRGLANQNLEGIRYVCIDEKSFGKGQDYVSVMTDPKASRLEPMKKVARMHKNRLENILSWFRNESPTLTLTPTPKASTAASRPSNQTPQHRNLTDRQQARSDDSHHGLENTLQRAPTLTETMIPQFAAINQPVAVVKILRRETTHTHQYQPNLGRHEPARTLQPATSEL